MVDTSAVSAPATFKQPSRKGKKAWRKNVDLTEVQQGLEDVREEIIKGGVIAEKDASQLFATDITGDEEIAQQQRGRKLLKAHEILAHRSAVPGLEGRKRKVEIVAGSSKRQKNGSYVPHKEFQRLRTVADRANGGFVVEAEHAVTHDPWAEGTTVKHPELNFLEEVQSKKEPKTLKQTPKSLTANGKRIPNVRKPDAGKSYNPLVSDWSALLQREGQAAVEVEQSRLAAEYEAAEREARARAEAARVEVLEREEYVTDYDSAWESEWDGFKSDTEQQVWTQKQKGRMTPAERTKVKARREREARERMERKAKERDAQEKRIAHIAKEVSATDKARKAHAVQLQTATNYSSSDDSDEAGDGVEFKRRRFGRVPIPDAPLEVVLPDELEDSLRRLKPEGNLMEERYRNLLVSGKMEVRRKNGQRKQPRTERREKWAYKDWKLR